jgi:uncharacterized membrane protein
MRPRWIRSLGLCCAAWLSSSPSYGQEYVTTLLATPPGYTTCRAIQSNDNGIVIGTCDRRAVVWRDGTPDVLRLPTGFTESRGAGINASGTVVGTCVSTELTAACVWEHGAVRLLPIPPDATGSSAAAVNSLGYVAGTLDHPRCDGFFAEPQAVVWSPSGPLQVLVLGKNGFSSCPIASESRDINDQGDVAVDVSVLSSYGAAVWTASGDFLGLPAVGSKTHAADINDRGEVVGYTVGVARALLWRNGVTVVLQPAGGAGEAEASGINNTGVVCGITAFDGVRPTVWREGVGEFLTNPEQRFGLTNRISNAGVVAGLLGDVAALFVPQGTLQAAQAISDRIDALLTSAILRRTDGTPLQALISAAMARLSKGNTVAATNILDAFTNNVAALVNSGRLAPQDAADLTNLVDDLIAQLQG